MSWSSSTIPWISSSTGSAGAAIPSFRRNAARSRCSRRCRSCRCPDFRRCRVCPRRTGGPLHRWPSNRPYRRSRLSVRCRARGWNGYRAADPTAATGRRLPAPRRGHRGKAQQSRRRPTRRRAHADPRRHHPFTASTVTYSQDPSIFAQPGQTVRSRVECTREEDTPKPPITRTIMLGCTIAALS
jgi:hypothetical protein